MTPLLIISAYLFLLIGLGYFSQRLSKGTPGDYFLASRGIGPFVLLMSVFGTTMTAFALIGSTGESYRTGIGVFGKMASWSALVHAAVFYFVGLRLWAFGRRYGYVTQVQYIRERYESRALGTLIFPILVSFVVPYLLIGILGAGGAVKSLTVGAFPEAFAETNGGIPGWLTGLVICAIVLGYIFFGGLRGAAWANTFQTLVFMTTGVVAFAVISHEIGGVRAATERVMEHRPEVLHRGATVGQLEFLSYALVPLSVGMFPHVFQHWLTARSAKAFRLTIIAHPLCILIVWLPCVLLGVWATSAVLPDGSLVVPEQHAPNTELAMMVEKLTSPVLTGILGAGILAAIMSSLDSQFFCLGTIFTEDIVLHHFGRERFNERQTIFLARGFIVAIVAITYALSLLEQRQVFRLGVWCFSGFSSLFPIVVAALYWKRVTRAGAVACVITTLVVGGILFVQSDLGREKLLVLGMMPVATMMMCSTAALVIVSLLTRPPSDATLERFFPRTL